MQYLCLRRGVKDQITVYNSLERIQSDLVGMMISSARVQKKQNPQVPVRGRCDILRADSYCGLGFIPYVHLSLVPISDLEKGCYKQHAVFAIAVLSHGSIHIFSHHTF